MPLGEEFSATLLVDVDGVALPDDVKPLMVSASVDSSRNVPDMFALRFSDERGIVLAKAKFTIGSVVKLQVQSSGPGGPVPLLTGEVTSVEAKLDPDGFHTVVRGFDKSHRLFRGRRVEAYVRMTGADIARKVAQRAGLSTKTISAGTAVLEHVMQDNVDDWEFLSTLAARVGAVVRVVDGALEIVDPTLASTAPAGGENARDNAQVLEKGVNLLWLRATVTAAGQVPEVEVRSWDVMQKKALVSVQPGKTVSAKLPDADPAKLAKGFGSPKYVEAAPLLVTQAQVELRAKALADRISAGFAELEGAAMGNPQLKAGAAVTLTGMGSPFDGGYTLSAVRHDFSADGYVTNVTVAGGSERSLFGTANGSRPGGGSPTGVLPAIVTDAKDPEGLGRVKLTLPVYSDTYESGWARVVAPGAGQNRGTGLLPEVGDEVLVAFGGGELAQPFVVGGLYNGKDKPAADQVGGTDGKIQRRVFVSRTGMRVEHLETPTAEELVLSTNTGKQKVRLVQKSDAAIEIISEGPVTITAKTDATVTAQKDISVTTSSGKVNVKGAQVTIEGSTSLTLKSPKLSMEGSATAELKGASVKVAGTGTAELSASGITTVRGAMVKIN